MDPLKVSLLDLVLSLLDLVRKTCSQSFSSFGHRYELQLFCTELEEYLQYVKEIKAHADAAGLKPKSFEILQSELQKLVSSAKGLFNGKDGCKMEDIRELRELAMRRLQERMAWAQTEMGIKSFEIQLKTYEELKAIKEMMVKKQEKKEMMVKKQEKKEMMAVLCVILYVFFEFFAHYYL